VRHDYTIPGVYSLPRIRPSGFSRVRTDVAGFVGAAGPNHLGEAKVIDDWKSYVATYRLTADGSQLNAPAGGALESAVRDFFANGGQRLYIVNIAPEIQEQNADELLNLILGLGPDPEPHGLELLLRQHEVSLVALPDFDSRRVELTEKWVDIDLPGNGCFRRCEQSVSNTASITGVASREIWQEQITPLFERASLLWAQRYLIDRLLQSPWRWFAILAVPAGSSAEDAISWREQLTAARGEVDVAALYWPWLQVQDSPGTETSVRSPIGAVTGLFARTDLEFGAHVAPANKALVGAIDLEIEVGDEDNSATYLAGVNVIRAFPGQGIRVWGARTLLWKGQRSRSEPLAFVSARRCLSAIARSVEVIGGPLVFEPDDAILRIRLHQIVTDYLLGVFESGALHGELPEQGFFVAVDVVNESAEGQLVCRVGVALAAPAEFIVFRLGRDSGVIETAEAA